MQKGLRGRTGDTCDAWAEQHANAASRTYAVLALLCLFILRRWLTAAVVRPPQCLSVIDTAGLRLCHLPTLASSRLLFSRDTTCLAREATKSTFCHRGWRLHLSARTYFARLPGRRRSCAPRNSRRQLLRRRDVGLGGDMAGHLSPLSPTDATHTISARHLKFSAFVYHLVVSNNSLYRGRRDACFCCSRLPSSERL